MALYISAIRKLTDPLLSPDRPLHGPGRRSYLGTMSEFLQTFRYRISIDSDCKRELMKMFDVDVHA
jgi:hypothetical protein